MRVNRWLMTVLVCGWGGLLPGLLPGGAAAQDWHPMTYSAAAPGIDENPLRGLIPYSFAPQGGFPHSMEWFYTPLSAVVVGQDTYDWRPVEKELAKIAARGDQAAFRFYLDFPGKPPAIPHYLLAAGLKTFAYDDFENKTSRTPSRAPDQSDPRLIQCLLHFIRAFGARYDGDPRIGYVTAGLVGFWGEWHVTGHPKLGEDAGWTMAQEDKDAILLAYRESFRKTMVLVRYPTVTQRADLLDNFGFHDDSFGNDTLGSEPWQFRRQLTMANAFDQWKTHPTGGEVYPQLQSHLWDAWPNPVGEDVTAALALTHATWMLDENLFEHSATPAQKANALRAHRTLGYTLVCSEARLAREADGGLTISVRMENRGIAPFYAAWPVEFEAVEGSTILAEGQANWPLATLLPGEHAEYRASFQDLPRHGATVVMRIANPLPNGHPVVFANAEMGTVKKGWLTLGKVAAP